MNAAPLYLIDTNIISELARPSPNRGVVKFISETPKLLVSTILFHDLTFGLETAPAEQKLKLAGFISAMKDRFGPRAIPITVEIAETAGRLRAAEKLAGRVLTVSDSLIAASSVAKGATLVTRNTKDFANLDLPLLNPF